MLDKKRRPQSQTAAALEYDRDRKGAPRIVAKGRGKRAERIVSEARAHDVHIESNPPLAEALMQVDVMQEIPAELYQTVAELLAFLYRIAQPNAKP